MGRSAASASWASAAAIDAAAGRCLRRKRGRPDAIAFRMNRGEEVLALAEQLAAGTYRPGPGIAFVVRRPKHREVHAASFRDRVVHHLVYGELEPLFEPGFAADSFACRKGKGTHAAVARLEEHLWRASRHGAVRVFALELDIRSFFASIHRPTLLALLGARLEPRARRCAGCASLWETVQAIVRHDPAAVAARRGPPADFARVPPHKRLGARGPDFGLPIGNLTSQFFANVYLNPLDQHVKRTLGVRSYVRYVDDLVLLDPDPEALLRFEAVIRAFLADRLRLIAHPIGALRPASDGVDFLGYVVRPRYSLARRRVLVSFDGRLEERERELASVDVPPGGSFHFEGLGDVAGPFRAWRLDAGAIEKLRATWDAYEGHLRHASAFRARGRLLEAHPVSRRPPPGRAGPDTAAVRPVAPPALLPRAGGGSRSRARRRLPADAGGSLRRVPVAGRGARAGPPSAAVVARPLHRRRAVVARPAAPRACARARSRRRARARGAVLGRGSQGASPRLPLRWPRSRWSRTRGGSSTSRASARTRPVFPGGAPHESTSRPTTLTWSAAATYCQGLSAGGFSSGWRLPTIKELQSLVDETTSGPAIDTNAFPGTPPTWFWSSSPSVYAGGGAWDVIFDGGYVDANGRGYSYRVRCVR